MPKTRHTVVHRVQKEALDPLMKGPGFSAISGNCSQERGEYKDHNWICQVYFQILQRWQVRRS